MTHEPTPFTAIGPNCIARALPNTDGSWRVVADGYPTTIYEERDAAVQAARVLSGVVSLR